MVASIAGCVEAVKRGRAEFALVPHFGDDGAFAGLRARQVGEDRLALVASPALKRPVALTGGRLTGPMMVYTPGTSYGAEIAAMLDRHGIAIQEARCAKALRPKPCWRRSRQASARRGFHKSFAGEGRSADAPRRSFSTFPIKSFWSNRLAPDGDEQWTLDLSV